MQSNNIHTTQGDREEPDLSSDSAVPSTSHVLHTEVRTHSLQCTGIDSVVASLFLTVLLNTPTHTLKHAYVRTYCHTHTHLRIHHGSSGRVVCRREGEGVEGELLNVLVDPSSSPLLLVVSIFDHQR